MILLPGASTTITVTRYINFPPMILLVHSFWHHMCRVFPNKPPIDASGHSIFNSVLYLELEPRPKAEGLIPHDWPQWRKQRKRHCITHTSVWTTNNQGFPEFRKTWLLVYCFDTGYSSKKKKKIKINFQTGGMNGTKYSELLFPP